MANLSIAILSAIILLHPDVVLAQKGLEQIRLNSIGCRVQIEGGLVNLEFPPFSDLSQIGTVKGIGAIRSITARQCTSLDRFLREMFTVPSLRYIDFTNSDVANEFSAVTSLPPIEHLIISGTKIEDFSFIGKLGELKKLDLSYTAFADSDIVHLAGLDHLTDLDLTYTEVSVSSCKTLSSLPSLRELSLIGAGVNESNYSSLRAFERPIRIILAGARSFDGAPGDCDLSFDNIHELGKAGISIFGAPTNGTEHTCSVVIKDEGAESTRLLTWNQLLSFSHPSAVVEIDLSALSKDDSSCDHLGKFENLRVLSLSGSRITDQIWRTIKKLPHLESLDVSNTRVSDVGIDQHNFGSEIQVIRADDTYIVGTSINSFKFPHLTSISFKRLNPRWRTIDLCKKSTVAGIRQLVLHPKLKVVEFTWSDDLQEHREEILSCLAHAASNLALRRIVSLNTFLCDAERSLFSDEIELKDDSYPDGAPAF